VRKYRVDHRPRRGTSGSTTWTSFVRNHAHAFVAADFLTVFTVRFQLLFALVIMDIHSRRILRVIVTPHPTHTWVSQQFREALPVEHPYRFVLLDRDILCSPEGRQCIEHLGVEVLQTPARAPKANAFCERLVGTLCRECLDFLIPVSENHARRLSSLAETSTTGPALTLRSDPAVPSLPMRSPLHPASTDTGFLATAVSCRFPSSAESTTITGSYATPPEHVFELASGTCTYETRALSAPRVPR
jgi:putative transposase